MEPLLEPPDQQIRTVTWVSEWFHDPWASGFYFTDNKTWVLLLTAEVELPDNTHMELRAAAKLFVLFLKTTKRFPVATVCRGMYGEVLSRVALIQSNQSYDDKTMLRPAVPRTTHGEHWRLWAECAPCWRLSIPHVGVNARFMAFKSKYETSQAE